MVKFKITYENDEGEEITVEVPGKYEICPDCRGKGSTYLGWTSSDQPAFTHDDFDREGPDFQEEYMRGDYDQRCPTCKGKRVVTIINEDACSSADMVAVRAYHNEQECLAEMQAEMEAERRMGC